MKRLCIVTTVIILFFAHVNSANYVEVDVWQIPDDTIYVNQWYEFRISIENDARLSGINLPFRIYSPDGVSWELRDVSFSQFDPATPNGGTFVTGVEGSRWMSGEADDGSCWDQGGTVVNDAAAPDTFVISGAALEAGLGPGPRQHMLSVHFTASGPNDSGDVRMLCIDSAFWPPSGQFVFDPGGAPGFTSIAWDNCLPVTIGDYRCPFWDLNLPTSMDIVHCDTGQVTLSATDIEGWDVKYYIADVSGGGTATAGVYSGIITYVPAPSDVGQPVQILVEATLWEQGTCDFRSWILDVTVTNTAPTLDCGQTYTIAAPPNVLIKSDILGQDDDACDDPVYFTQSITPTPVGSFDIDAETGEFTFTPTVQDYGLFTVCTGCTDGVDTSTCCFDIDVVSQDACIGDPDGSCETEISDAVYLINYIFKNGPRPPVMNWADVNADCEISIADAVYLIEYIFKGGPEPQLGCVYQ